MKTVIRNKISGVLGQRYDVLKGYSGQGITWDNEMNFGMNHAPCAGSIAGPGITLANVMNYSANHAPGAGSIGL